MQKGFIVPFIIFIGIAFIGYYFYTNNQIEPTQKTQEISKTIIEYPNSQNWQITPEKSFCPFNIVQCVNPPQTIDFTTKDPWSTIYGYYVGTMSKYGWQSNNLIVTSIPTSVVFTNEQNCEAALKENKGPFIVGNSDSKKYLFTVICQ